jgi:hypothetical protein
MRAVQSQDQDCEAEPSALQVYLTPTALVALNDCGIKRGGNTMGHAARKKLGPFRFVIVVLQPTFTFNIPFD